MYVLNTNTCICVCVCVCALTLSHSRTDLRSSSSDYVIQENQHTCWRSWLCMIIPCRQSYKLALLWETVTLNWIDSVPLLTMSGRQSIRDCFVLRGGEVGSALGVWRVLFSEFHMAHLHFLCGTPVCHKAWVEKHCPWLLSLLAP